MQFTMEVARYHQLKERLKTDYPDLDSETLADFLEGITDLHEMIAAVIRSALLDEALHSGLRARLKDMNERLSRLDVRAHKKRQLALEVMSEAGLSRLEQPDFTASTRAGSSSLLIVAEELIPQTYWLPQSPKLDRQSVLSELKSGVEIPGVQMTNPQPVLMVRTK